LLSNARTLIQLWEFTDAYVVLHALLLYHIHGLFVALHCALLSGAKILFHSRFDAGAVVNALPNATVMMGVPTFYTRLLNEHGFTSVSARAIRLFVSGSAPLLAETHREWETRTGHVLLERYGMTETNMNTSNPYRGARIPGSVGLPLPGVELRIADSDGNPVASGEIGMIEIRGPNVFQGYWNMPEKTAAEFRKDGFFITGDLGTIGPDGYVRIVGRGKDLIITGGLNVYPSEVESLLDAIPGVEEAAVVGLPHEDFGEGVTAFLVTKPGAELTETGVLEALRGAGGLRNCKVGAGGGREVASDDGGGGGTGPRARHACATALTGELAGGVVIEVE
jgi:malonyl-CoA/methylmalonyl-CoA synthetase